MTPSMIFVFSLGFANSLYPPGNIFKVLAGWIGPPAMFVALFWRAMQRLGIYLQCVPEEMTYQKLITWTRRSSSTRTTWLKPTVFVRRFTGQASSWMSNRTSHVSLRLCVLRIQPVALCRWLEDHAQSIRQPPHIAIILQAKKASGVQLRVSLENWGRKHQTAWRRLGAAFIACAK